jgi:hypothetical protein
MELSVVTWNVKTSINEFKSEEFYLISIKEMFWFVKGAVDNEITNH